MADILKKLYNTFREIAPINQEAIDSAQAQLLEMYKHPEILNSIFQLLIPSEEEFFREQAAISLKCSLPQFYEILRDNLEIRETLLNIFSTETNLIVRHLLIEASRPFFSDGINEWPNFISYLDSLSSSNDPNKIELFLSVYSASISYVPMMCLGEHYESLCFHALSALNSSDPNIIISGSDLLCSLSSSAITEEERTLGLYHAQLSTVFRFLSSRSHGPEFPFLGRLLENLCNFINNSTINDSIGPTLLSEIFQYIKETPEIRENPDSACLLADPICALILHFSSIITDTLTLTEILGVVMDISTSCYEEDFPFLEQTNIIMICSILEALVQIIPSDDFFSTFWEHKPVDTPASIIATSIALVSFIEHIPETISDNFSEIISFVFTCLSGPPSIAEAGFHIISELLDRNADLFTQSEILSKLCEALFNALDSSHFPILHISLTVLSKLLYAPSTSFALSIENSINLAHRLNSMLNSITSGNSIVPPSNCGLLIQLLLVTVAALSRASGDIPDVCGTLLPSITAAATSEGLPQARGLSAEAIGYIIRGCPTETSGAFPQAFQLITDLLHEDDPSLISSAMIALSALSSCPEPLHNTITQAISSILPFLLNLISNSLANLKIVADDDGDIELNAEAETQRRSLQLIEKLAKNTPELVSPHSLQLLELSLIGLQSSTLGGCRDPILQRYAIRSIVYLSKLVAGPEGIPQQAFKAIISLAHSSSAESSAIAFYGLTKLVHNKLLPPVEHGELAYAIELALSAADHCLECQGRDFDSPEQNEQQETGDVFSEAFGLFAEIAQVEPSSFPLGKLLQLSQAAIKNGETDDVIEYVGAFTEYAGVAFESFPEIYRGSLIEIMSSSLDLVDLNKPPYPLSAARVLLEKNAMNVIVVDGRPDFPGAPIGISANAINASFSGESYYWEVKAAAISFMLSVFCLHREFVAPYADILPKILAYVPECLNESEGQNILSCMMDLVKNGMLPVENFGGEILRAFTETFELRKSKWISLQLQQPLCSEMARLCLQLNQSGDHFPARLKLYLDGNY